MQIKRLVALLILLNAWASYGQLNGSVQKVDVLIVGAGASGTMAGIQSARLGAKTLLIDEGPWLGGMLTSAGVSAIDGNHQLHSGLWNEFRQHLYDHYGGPKAVKTGWVSNVLFEPSVGQQILRRMVSAEKELQVWHNCRLSWIKKEEQGWSVFITDGTQEVELYTKVLIDGTELGDVAKEAGVPYRIGMDRRAETGEEIASESGNDIIQDLTYVAVLQDFGAGADKTIARPENYDPSPFFCTCAGRCDADTVKATLWECDFMMNYGELPNKKYMINWPIYGNDYYLNLIELSADERQKELEKAKWFTRCYIYYLQTELGYKNIGIAENEFPTEDGLPLIPYHRESRRIKGKVLFTVNDLARPFEQNDPLYRTGIAVGDYPIDHHHAAYHGNEELPDIHFYPVPSYSLPMGTLLPAEVEDLIVAEKSISVTNIVNGTTRLQPVCILNGQAAGAIAAIAVREACKPGEVSVRQVQSELLKAGAYLMPYCDVQPNEKEFAAIQRIGATGILKGEGKNVGWQNLTLFHPDSVLTVEAIANGLEDLGIHSVVRSAGESFSLKETISLLKDIQKTQGKKRLNKKAVEAYWVELAYGAFNEDAMVSRRQFAVLLDHFCDPFHYWEVDIKGHVLPSKKH